MAAEFLAQKVDGRLRPETAGDAEIMDALVSNVTYKLVATRPIGRSVQHHRLLFALIGLAVENYDGEITAETVLSVLKLRTGHVNVMSLPTGEVVMTPKSINFVTMGRDEFTAWFVKAVVVLCRDFVPGLGEEMARREIERRANGARVYALPAQRTLPAPRDIAA
jgi:hypothetical protein